MTTPRTIRSSHRSSLRGVMVFGATICVTMPLGAQLQPGDAQTLLDAARGTPPLTCVLGARALDYNFYSRFRPPVAAELVAEDPAVASLADLDDRPTIADATVPVLARALSKAEEPPSEEPDEEGS